MPHVFRSAITSGCEIPNQDASHHKDCYIFSRGSLFINLHFPLLLEGKKETR